MVAVSACVRARLRCALTRNASNRGCSDDFSCKVRSNDGLVDKRDAHSQFTSRMHGCHHRTRPSSAGRAIEHAWGSARLQQEYTQASVNIFFVSTHADVIEECLTR